MKIRTKAAIALLAGLAGTVAHAHAAPPPTSFTYQGALTMDNSPVNGLTALQFKLWDAPSGGTQLGSTLSTFTNVDDGLFSESLDFGAASFGTSQALWLEVIVEGQVIGRTPLEASPYSLSTRGLKVAPNGLVAVGPGPSGVVDIDPQVPLDTFGGIRVREGVFNGPSSGRGIEFKYSNTLHRGIFETVNRDTGSYGSISMVPNGGNIAIGRLDPRARLDVEGSAIFAGAVGIGTSTPATMLDINGAITIRGGADIVEGFDSSCGTAFEPGTVLVIDPANPGKLMCSENAYDFKVAGVVSGANGVQPGIKLGQEGVMDGDIPVAMTGRVYVKCSAENGPIQPGDRLTTAALSGHAMKATDSDLSDGAVIGKAMSTLDEGTGMVLVLVNLQ